MTKAKFRILGVILILLGWVPYLAYMAGGGGSHANAMGFFGFFGMVFGFVAIGASSTIARDGGH